MDLHESGPIVFTRRELVAGSESIFLNWFFELVKEEGDNVVSKNGKWEWMSKY